MSGHRLSRLPVPSPRGRPYVLVSVCKGILYFLNTQKKFKEIFKKYPLAIVNSKKIAGGSSAKWKTIWEYAERDKVFLRTQIREILKPNIIVCGGSNDTENEFRKVLSIALEYIFPDIREDFKKINNWCYYNSEKDILLIDSYHPSLIMDEQDKIEGLVNGFHDFILKTNYKH